MNSIFARRLLVQLSRNRNRILQAYSSRGGFDKFYKKKRPDETDKKSREEGVSRQPEKPLSHEAPKDAADASEGSKREESKRTEDAPKKEETHTPKESAERKDSQQKKEEAPKKTVQFKIEVKKIPKKDANKSNDEDPEDEEDDKQKKNWSMAASVGIAFAVLWVLRKRRSDVANAAQEIDWEQFRKLLANGEVSKVKIANNTLALIFTEGISRLVVLRMTISSGTSFEKQLELTEQELDITPDRFVPVVYEHSHEFLLVDTLISCLPALFFLWLFRSASSGMGSMRGNPFDNKKKFTFTAAKKITTTFKDVAGLHEAKQEITELVDFLKDPAKYEKLGAKIPKGCLLVGPPGVGKTLLAKATAGEAGVPFLSISGSDFVEIFVGVGPSRIRDMFKEARRVAPAIIFIDEIDAIGRSRRGGKGGGNDERESTLNALLVEMDGFNTKSGVVVLAGTNRPDILDKALLRPGRFDRQVALEAPPLADRIEIFQVHLRPLTLDPSMTKDEAAKHLATLTSGFSGADIMNCCNEAALIAARAKAEFVGMNHFEMAIDRIIGGLEKKARVLTKWEKRVVAHHEAGHAVVGWFSEFVDPLLKVSIQPRANGILGYAHYLPKDRYIKTVNELFEEMCVALGGTAAEKIMFDHKSTGAADDLRRVTNMAYRQVTLFGMTDVIGHLSFPQGDDDEYSFQKPYSRTTEKKIDDAVREIVDKAYSRTENLLREKRPMLEKLANLLLEKEVLRLEDIVSILGPRPYGMPEIYEAKKDKEKAAGASAESDKGEKRKKDEDRHDGPMTPPQPAAA